MAETITTEELFGQKQGIVTTEQLFGGQGDVLTTEKLFGIEKPKNWVAEGLKETGKQLIEHPFLTTLAGVGRVMKVARWPFWRAIEHPVSTITTEAQKGKIDLGTIARAGESLIPFKKVEQPKHYEDIWNNYYKSIMGTEAPDWYKIMASYGTAMGVETPAIRGAEKGIEKLVTRPATPRETQYLRGIFKPLKDALNKRGLDTSKLHPQGNVVTLSDKSQLFMNKNISAVLRGEQVRIPRWAKIPETKAATIFEPSLEKAISPISPTISPITKTPTIIPPVLIQEPEIITSEQLFKQTPEDIARAEFEKGIDEYMAGEPGKGNLYSIIKSEGGISPYTKTTVGALKEEYRENVPLVLRSKTGLPLDEMASALAEKYPHLGVTDENSLLQVLEAEKARRLQPSAGGLVHIFPQKLAEKGIAIIDRENAIKITQDTDATDIYGNKVKLPKGEEYTPYKLSNQQILLQDGEQIVINKNQFQNIKGKNIELGEKTISPEEAQVEEVVKGQGGEVDIKKRADEILSIWLSEGQKDTPLLRQRARNEAAGEIEAEGKTKFSQYQLPGGENYREVLFKATGKDIPVSGMVGYGEVKGGDLIIIEANDMFQVFTKDELEHGGMPEDEFNTRREAENYLDRHVIDLNAQPALMITPEVKARMIGQPMAGGMAHKQKEHWQMTKKEVVSGETQVIKSKFIDKAKKYFGLTDNLREAGYILPNGELLDLSGKNQGGTPGVRALDHREINFAIPKGLEKNPLSGMTLFTEETGSIRIDYNAGAIDIMKKPTEKQLSFLEKVIREKNGEVVIDLTEGKSKYDEQGKYEIPPAKRQSFEYKKGTDIGEIISNIEKFYSMGEVGEANIEILTAPFRAIAEKLDAVQYQVKHPISKAIINDIQYVNIRAHRAAAEWLMRVDYFRGLKKEYDTLLTDLMEGKYIDLPKEEFNKLFVLKQKIRKSLEEAWQKANAVGVKVKITDETGTHWRPIGKIENYVPREIHPDIKEQLDGGLKQLYDKMLELRNKGVTHNVKEAILAEKKSGNTYIVRLLKWLEEKEMKASASTLVRLIDKLVNRDYIASYGHLERPRLIADALPPEFYERRASVLFTRYFSSAARRIAEIERFGQTNEKLLRRLRFVERVSSKEGKILRDLLKTYQDKTKHEIANTLASIISTVKIGLGTSTIPNITQTLISTIPKQGVFNFLRGALDLIVNPQTKLFIQKTGLPYTDVVRGIVGYENYGLLGRVNDLLLTMNWFKGVNRLNSLLTAASTEKWVTKVLIPATHSFMSMRKQWALDNLAKLKIYPKDLTTGGVSEEKLIDAMYLAASNYQLFSDITNEPYFLSKPENRWLTILKRFGYKQALFALHEVIYDELKHANPLPLLRLIAGGILGGAFVIWANRKIYDIITWIQEQITEETREPPDWYTKWNDEDISIMNKAIDLMSQAGTVGALTDITRLDSQGKWSLERQAEFQLKPVVASELERAFRIVDFLKKGEKKVGRRIIEIEPRERISRALGEVGKMFPISKFLMQKERLLPQKIKRSFLWNRN